MISWRGNPLLLGCQNPHEERRRAKRDPPDDRTGLRHFGLSCCVPFSVGDDPMHIPCMGNRRKEHMFLGNIKSQWRRLKNWILRWICRVLHNPRLLKGAFITGIFVYRLYKALKDLVGTPDG